jgi:hypothetical protein
LIRSLCQALGPGDPEKDDLLLRGKANHLAADEDWPFNWLLLTYIARSVLARTKSSYRAPSNDETRQTLQGFEIGAHEWLRLASRRPALHDVDASTKAAFRAWWVQVVSAYTELRERVWCYPHHFADDVRDAISHMIGHMSVRFKATMLFSAGTRTAVAFCTFGSAATPWRSSIFRRPRPRSNVTDA